MGTTTFARAEEANIGILEAKLEREFWHSLFFARFAGFVEKDKTGGDIPPNTPIVIKREYAQEGMDQLLIPMLRRLTGAGVYGDNQLLGNEEAMSIYYHKTYINQRRNGVKLGGRAAMQRVKKFNLFSKQRPVLERWMAEATEWMILYAFFKGWSPHLLATTANGGLYINSNTQRSHPNFWVPGTGVVTWSATEATYDASIHTALAAMSDASTYHCTTANLEELRVIAIEKNLQPIMADGIEVWPLLLHPKSVKQLRADSAWVNAQKDANVRGLKNPIFTGAAGIYAGFLVFERQIMPGVSSAASVVTYGATNPLSSLDTYDRKTFLAFGNNAVSWGWADGPYFDEEYEDYKNLKGVGVGIIDGAARADFLDSNSSPSAVVNQSSIAGAFYSA